MQEAKQCDLSVDNCFSPEQEKMHEAQILEVVVEM